MAGYMKIRWCAVTFWCAMSVNKKSNGTFTIFIFALKFDALADCRRFSHRSKITFHAGRGFSSRAEWFLKNASTNSVIEDEKLRHRCHLPYLFDFHIELSFAPKLNILIDCWKIRPRLIRATVASKVILDFSSDGLRSSVLLRHAGRKKKVNLDDGAMPGRRMHWWAHWWLLRFTAADIDDKFWAPHWYIMKISGQA